MNAGDLEFGLRVTVLGLGLVLAVLLLLWLLLEGSLRLDRGQTPPADPEATADLWSDIAELRDVPADARAGSFGDVTVISDTTVEPALLAAITIAVVRHAEARRLQAAPAMRSYWPGSLLFASRWVAAGRTRQGAVWPRRR